MGGDLFEERYTFWLFFDTIDLLLGVHWQGGEQGKIGQYLAVPTIYGSLCAMWNRNSWCERHLVAGLEIHTCSVTLWQEDPREYLFLNRFELSLQTICPANEITLFLWNYPDFSQVPCHNRVGQWVTRLKWEPVSTRLLRGSQPSSWKMCWRAPQTRVSAWNRHFVEEMYDLLTILCGPKSFSTLRFYSGGGSSSGASSWEVPNLDPWPTHRCGGTSEIKLIYTCIVRIVLIYPS